MVYTLMFYYMTSRSRFGLIGSDNYLIDRVGNVAAANAPLFGVEVVGAITEVFHETEHTALICNSYIASRSIVEGNRLSAKICDSSVVVDFDARDGI